VTFTVRNTSSITLVLLGVLAFLFFHSEMGLFECDGGDHGNHDYCEVVKSVGGSQAALKHVTCKVAVVFHYSPGDIDDQRSLYIASGPFESRRAFTRLELHLDNCILLI
jgi:hypothetical protein